MNPSIAPRFDNACVVVTGVGRAGQLGEIVARAFGELGATVHCIDRGGMAEARVAELRADKLEAVAHTVDLTDFDAVRRLATEIATAHTGNVDVVAALAGGFAMSGPIADSDPATFDRQIAISLTTAYSTARAFLPAVRAAKGSFVFATSTAVLPGGRAAGMSAYAAAKGGLVQLVRALAQEERDSGVRANALAPTALRTTANVDSMGDGVRYVEREEFAAALVALCGPAFRRVTGQVLELA
jgi:NAD(P)-dependent dehydrogenase (short-subunit alcohol dehydrogenase family)